MTTHSDLIVVGLGITGAAAAWQAARQGACVIALEQGGPTHPNGSSHGATRIFRQAYWEGDKYLPLLHLADQGWRDLEAASGMRLRIPSGGVFIGPRSTGVVEGSRRTALRGGISHEHWPADVARMRFPQFHVADDMEAVHEPGAYAVLAEESRLQMLNEAVRMGARLQYGDAVTGFEAINGGVKVHTRDGQVYAGGAALVCAGAWARTLVPELSEHLQPQRVPIFWFAPRNRQAQPSFEADAFPVFLYETPDGKLLYGIPTGCSAERGVKIGFHNHQHLVSDPGSTLPDIAPFAHEISQYVASIFPQLDPQPMTGKWCFYTMTPDEAFVLGESRHCSKVFYASACSGHGFKFAPAIGHVMAELGRGVHPMVNVEAFSPHRLDARPSAVRQ